MVQRSISSNSQRKKWYTSLTYLGRVDDKVGSILTKQDLNIAFKINNTLGRHIKRNKKRNKEKL